MNQDEAQILTDRVQSYVSLALEMLSVVPSEENLDEATLLLGLCTASVMAHCKTNHEC